MPSPRIIQPVLAALLAACVLLLGFASVSPALHGELCGHAGHAHGSRSPVGSDDDRGAAPVADADHGCAITLFSAGCTAATPEPPLLPPPALNAARVAAFTEVLLARTLRGPERVCGPPVSA